MAKFILRRLLGSVFVIWIIVTISFALVRAVPGNPFAEEKATDAQAMRNQLAKYNLLKPVFPVYVPPSEEAIAEGAFPVDWGGEPPAEIVIGDLHIVVSPAGIAQTQYVGYLLGLLQGDLGMSYSQEGRSVTELLFTALPWSIQLGCQALLFALLIGIPAGLIAGLRQNRWPDYTAMGAAMIGVSVPNFVLGPLLILLLVVGLGIFQTGPWDNWFDSLLPSFALGVYFAAYVARLTRAGTLEIIRQDYIRTARAKGLVERTIITRHAMRGSLLPVVSYLGPAFAAMLTGSVVIEEIFGVPGVGNYFVRGALNRDYNLVLGTVILYSTLLVLLNVLVDVLYTVLDPRVSYDSGKK